MTQDPSATTPAPPQPAAEHERIQQNVGTWRVACKFYMDPSQPPMEVEGKETVEAFGPFWTQGVFEADMFGAPFKGRGTLGYDPKAGEYVSTWIDTMAPTYYLLRGNYDASGKVLEMKGEAWDCMTDRMTDYRTTEERREDGSRVVEMFMTMPDGSEFRMFTHVYTRA